MIHTTPKFRILSGDYQDVLDFAQFIHNDLGQTVPDVFFHREPDLPTPTDCYNYLREIARDGQQQVTEMPERLLECMDDSGDSWQHLTDLAPEDERVYVEAVALIWIRLIAKNLATNPIPLLLN